MEKNMEGKMTFQNAIDLYRSIYRRYDKIYERKWGVEGAMIELSKQVGDLAKRVLVTEKYYYPGIEDNPSFKGGKDAISVELADVLGQLIRVADYYGIDLEEAHINARKAEDRSLQKRGT